MIDIQNITKVYNTKNGKLTAVDNVSLSINKGEIYGIIGYSGAGKSTMIRLLNGLEKPTTGSVIVGGQDIAKASGAKLREARQKISMIFQHFNLLWSRTVEENIAFPLEIAGVSKADREKRVEELIELVGLKGRGKAYPSQLSGGQKQRVAIGSAIIRQPKAFLMDEPLSNLDAKLRTQMRVELAKLHKKLNTTIIYVTHDQTEAMTLASKIVVMKGGVVQQVATPAAIYNHPANKFVAGFIGSPSMNFFEAKVSALGEKKNKAVLSFGKNQEKMVIIDGPRGEVLARSRNGQHVIMGIRPEDITDYEDAVKGGFERSSIGITERITAREMLGSEVFLYFDECDTSCSVRLKPNNTTQLNEKMTFYFNPNKVHIFDCNTEENLF